MPTSHKNIRLKMQSLKRKERYEDLVAIASALDIIDMKKKTLKNISRDDAMKKMAVYGADPSFFVQFGHPYVKHKRYIPRPTTDRIYEYEPSATMREYYFESGNENFKKAKTNWNTCNEKWKTYNSTSLLNELEKYKIPCEDFSHVALYIGDFFVLDSKLGYIVNFYVDQQGKLTLGLFFSFSSEKAIGNLDDYVEFTCEKVMALLKNGDSILYLQDLVRIEKRNKQSKTSKLKMYKSILQRYKQAISAV